MKSHPFYDKPHRTIITLSIPVTISMVAEPITGMVDTAFVSNLGSAPLAGLGVGATALSTIFWVFSFLSISTQTEVAHALGRRDRTRAVELTSLALFMAAFFSLVVMAVFIPTAGVVSSLLGAEPDVKQEAMIYLRIRLLGAPAIMIATFVGFGALRGIQDMRTPLWIAVTINLLNIVLDRPMIAGLGPIPAMGVGGAALASTISQWIGAIWTFVVVYRKLGFVYHTDRQDALKILRVGSDLFIRAGLLACFLLISTRVANQIGAEAGAAHQAIRTVWMLSGWTMEGFAVTAQSLVGFFMGADTLPTARRVANLSVRWGVGTGIVLSALMLISVDWIIALLVPDDVVPVFRSAWVIVALMQPLLALAFVTDGIHWGTGDYAFMRNAMLTSSFIGAVGLFLIDPSNGHAFTLLWLVTGLWMLLRSGLGMVRVWPGFGTSPLGLRSHLNQHEHVAPVG